MEVSGKPRISTRSGESEPSTGLVIGLAAFGVMLIGAGIYLWLRNRSAGDQGDDTSKDHTADLPESEDSDDLMDAIIALDDLYQAGEIPEEAYLKRRADLKERLRGILEREGTGELGS